MKKMYLLAVLMAATMPFTAMAQDDDLYFNPKKEAKKQAEHRAQLQRAYAEQKARRDSIYALYWSGSNRSVDEYNRGGRFLSHYENVGKDSLGNDIIQFHVGKGVAPDSIYDDAYFAQKYADPEEDFSRTREMSRWDGYYDPWYYGYAGWYGGWYSPWYYGWGGYYNPWYWGGPMIGHVSYGGFAGNKRYNNPGRIDGSNHQFTGIAGNNRNTYSRRSGSNRSFGQRQNNGNYNNNNSSWDSRGNSSFGNSGGSFGGGSFSGGGRSGGGSFGGGGGHSGGGSYGGRR